MSTSFATDTIHGWRDGNEQCLPPLLQIQYTDGEMETNNVYLLCYRYNTRMERWKRTMSTSFATDTIHGWRDGNEQCLPPSLQIQYTDRDGNEQCLPPLLQIQYTDGEMETNNVYLLCYRYNTRMERWKRTMSTSFATDTIHGWRDGNEQCLPPLLQIQYTDRDGNEQCLPPLLQIQYTDGEMETNNVYLLCYRYNTPIEMETNNVYLLRYRYNTPIEMETNNVYLLLGIGLKGSTSYDPFGQ